MRRLMLTLCLVPAAGAAASPQEDVQALAAIAKDRADTQAWLKSDPTSHLAAVDRKDFGPRKTMTVGRAKDSDVRLDDPSVSPHHLRVTVEGDAFRVQAVDAAARFLVKGTAAAVREAVVGPSAIRVGRFVLRLSHQGFPAVIVFDPKSPRFKEYKGIEYFPPDLSYRFVLDLKPDPKPETVVILSTRGNARRALRLGWFEFRLAGKPCRLAVDRLLEPGVGEDDLSVFFRDATTGKETYPIGRYVDPKKRPDGKYVLDFNMAFNPACAYSTRYNCPLPPKENTLPVSVRAGEKDSHYH